MALIAGGRARRRRRPASAIGVVLGAAAISWCGAWAPSAGAGSPVPPVVSAGPTATRRPAADASSPTIEWGVNSNFRWSVTIDRADVDLAQLDGTNVTAIREDVLWNVVEPTRGVFDWNRYDRLVGTAAAHGLEVLPLFNGSAPWATASGATAAPPQQPSDEVDLVEAYLSRYGPGGTFWSSAGVPAHPARVVEVWNEPWYGRFWGPDGADAATYAALVRAVATSVHTHHAGVAVVASGDWKWDNAMHGMWLDALLHADPGLVDVVDAFSAHPYPWPMSTPGANCASTRQQLQAIRTRLNVTSRPDVPVWITELGARTTAPAGEQGATQDEAAAYLRCVLGSPDLPVLLGAHSRVVLFQFEREAPAGDPRDGGYDLLDASGRRTPVLNAYLQLATGAPAPAASSLADGGSALLPARRVGAAG